MKLLLLKLNSASLLYITTLICISFFTYKWALAPEMTFYVDDWGWLARATFSTWNSFVSIWTVLPAALFMDRPIEEMSIKFLYQIFKLNHLGFGITLLTLHTINGILIFLIGSELFKSRFYGFISSILFLINIYISYPVWWAATIADSACLLFCLLSFLFYIKGNLRSIYLAAIFYYLATRSKEAAIPFYGILFLYTLILEGNFKKIVDIKKSLLHALSKSSPIFVIFLIIFGFASYYFIEGKLNSNDFGPYKPKFSLGTVIDGLSIYTRVLLFDIPTASNSFIAFSTALFLGILVRSRLVIFSSLSFIIAASPVLILATQRVPYYAYIPGPYFYFLIVAILYFIQNKICTKKIFLNTYKIFILLSIFYFIHIVNKNEFISKSVSELMKKNSNSLYSMRLVLNNVLNDSSIVVLGVPPGPNPFFAYAPCHAIRVVYKVKNLQCYIQEDEEVLLKKYNELKQPKILLKNDSEGSVTLIDQQ